MMIIHHHYSAVCVVCLQELVSQVEKTKNTVDSTNQPKLYERLEAIQGQLALCEKALAEYLETKRLAFPRFYFVSSTDLLDILSNGNNPVSVSALSKLTGPLHKHCFQFSFFSHMLVHQCP
jgi:dynein heavy chain